MGGDHAPLRIMPIIWSVNAGSLTPNRSFGSKPGNGHGEGNLLNAVL